MAIFSQDEQDFLNQINTDKSKNVPIFSEDLLNNVYKNITNRLTRVNENVNANPSQTTKKQAPVSSQSQSSGSPVENVIAADTALKKDVERLYTALSALGDKEIAKKLVGQHILMLNEVFKEFE